MAPASSSDRPGASALTLPKRGKIQAAPRPSMYPKAPAPVDNTGGDFRASIVVFLVALPLCMGIAQASGVPPELGLITGIVGGLVVGFLAGSPLQVSGPAAGLILLVSRVVETYGTEYGFAALGLAVLLAGTIQLAAGLAKLGRWFRAVSPAVIGGMLAGIGVLILVSQFHYMLDSEPPGGAVNNLLAIPSAIRKGVAPMEGDVHHLAATVGIVTILAIVGWNRFRPDALKVIPGALLAVVIATVGSAIFGWQIKLIELEGNLLHAVTLPNLNVLTLLGDAGFIREVLAIALIASAETLLCAAAVDRMQNGPRTNYDRELAAQGIGNMICGVLGALPMTGVIVRSSANINAGGKTRLSAILHGGWLLAFVILVPFILEYIPSSALAAILVYTGYRLADPRKLITMWKNVGPGDAVVYVGTVIAIVAFGLLEGVAIGVALALTKLLWRIAQLEVHVEQPTATRIDVSLRGAATFIRLPLLAETLEKLPPQKEVHLHVGGLGYIDHACMDILNDWQHKYEIDGQVVVEWDIVWARSQGSIADINSPVESPSETVPPSSTDPASA